MPRTLENPSYWSNQSMAADVEGAVITLGPEGSLHAVISWASAGSPVGTLSLQFQRLNGTWDNVPGASEEFTANNNSQPNGDTKTIYCHWRKLGVYKYLRLKYTPDDGGSASSNLSAEVTAS